MKPADDSSLDPIESAFADASQPRPSAALNERMDTLWQEAPATRTRPRLLLLAAGLCALIALPLFMLLGPASPEPTPAPRELVKRPAEPQRSAPILPPGITPEMVANATSIRPSAARVARRPVLSNLAADHAADPAYQARLAQIDLLFKNYDPNTPPQDQP